MPSASTWNISYSGNRIRIAPTSSNPEIEEQPNNGDPNIHYLQLDVAIPDGACYRYEEIHQHRYGKEDEITYSSEIKTISDSDKKKKIRSSWLEIARRADENSKYIYVGENGPIGTTANGYTKIFTWFDENLTEISKTVVELEYLKADDYKPFYDYKPIDESEGGTQSIYSAEQEGMYTVKVTRTRNNDTTSAFGIDYRVTAFPKTPVFIDGTPNEIEVIVKPADISNAKLDFTLDTTDTPFDRIKIEWKIKHTDNKGNRADFIVWNKESDFQETIGDDLKKFVTIGTELSNFATAIDAHNDALHDEEDKINIIGSNFYPVVYILRNGGTSLALNDSVNENGEMIEPVLMFEVQRS